MRIGSGKPRKIFCIGFHKTGTSSLGSALRLLGFSVCGAVGVNDPFVQRNIERIIARNVPRYDAFEDNPWPVLYKNLDERYPGSRFILTWRDPDDWIKSVVGHFGGTSTPMREWIYGYGDPRGHESAYVKTYIQHGQDVSEHFSDRTGTDFMIMRIMEGDGWEKVCSFLELPPPRDLPFPHQNRAGNGKSDRDD
jgi:hypothetical protein